MSNRKPPPAPKPPKDHFWESVAAYIVIVACFVAFIITCMAAWH